MTDATMVLDTWMWGVAGACVWALAVWLLDQWRPLAGGLDVTGMPVAAPLGRLERPQACDTGPTLPGLPEGLPEAAGRSHARTHRVPSRTTTAPRGRQRERKDSGSHTRSISGVYRAQEESRQDVADTVPDGNELRYMMAHAIALAEEKRRAWNLKTKVS